MGPRGSGKTTVGRKFAEKLGIFHVSFREFLQDRIMPKMKKPPLVDQDDFEGEESQDPEEDGKYNVVLFKLTITKTTFITAL